jgi:hypothetical protein
VQEGNGQESAHQRSTITFVMPLLLLAALGGWYWLSRSVPPPAAIGPTPALSVATAAPAAAEATPVAEGTVGLVGLATPWGAAGLEPTATATVSVVAPGAIAVLGPPAGSRFRAADAVTFYWSWPDELADGQRFVVYVLDAGERRPLGEVDEANLGRAYQLRAAVGQAGDFRWEVVLEDGATGEIIGRSEPRTIAIVGG